MKKLHLVSLGCTKNLVDSEVMLAKLPDYAITQDSTDADVIIVNTCGFIEAAKKESLNTIFDLHENRKADSLLVMAGCLSERYRDELQKELTEVDIFTGVGDYDKIDQMIAQKKGIFSHSAFLIREEERVITGSRSHAYVKLSEGCNQKCSFCAIPTFKGTLQSRPIDEIVTEIRKLKARGYYDFSLVSQDSSSFGRDFGDEDALIKLIEEIDKMEGVYARILYLYPTTTSLKLIEAIANSKNILPYFDMPIQHISDPLLKIMKRGAGEQKIIELLEAMREVEGSFLRTSIIVGHPGESDEDFEELCTFMEKFDFDRVNIFAYSDEENTKAFEMKEKIDKKTINARIKKLDKIVRAKLKKSLKNEVGKMAAIVIEGQSSEGEYFMGAKKLLWAPDIDGEILINESDAGELKIGGLYEVQITDLAGDKLVGAVTREL